MIDDWVAAKGLHWEKLESMMMRIDVSGPGAIE